MPYKTSTENPILKKAVGDLAILFPLGARADLIAAQAVVKAQLPDAVLNDPAAFHITAVMTNGSDPLPTQRELEWGFPAIALIVDSINSFETQDGYVIYAQCRWSGDLNWVQETLFRTAVSPWQQEHNVMVSSFSLPEYWIPHITLATSATPFTWTQIEAFAVLVNKIVISDENHNELVAYQMKAVELPVSKPLITKALQLNVISKGVHFNDEGDLIIPMIGIPFKGPVTVDVGDGVMKAVADLAGDWFHEGTELPMVNEVGVNWDHDRWQNYAVKEIKELKAKGIFKAEDLEAMSADFGFPVNRDIGVAVKKGLTEDGVVYHIILNRHTKYLKGLAQAATDGLIQGSGEFKSFEYDAEIPGKVNFADLVKIAITPSAYNNMAAVVEKSVTMEGDIVAKGTGAATEVKTDPAGAAPSAPEAAAPVESVSVITAAVRAKSAALKGDETPTVEGEVVTDADGEEAVVITKALFMDLVNAVKGIAADQQTILKSLSDFQSDLGVALPELGPMIAASLTETIQDSVTGIVKKSKLELNTESSVFGTKTADQRKQTPKPVAAPIHNKAVSMAGYPGSN